MVKICGKISFNNMYFHYQNLKKEEYNENVLVHGRCWLNHDYHAEWCVPSRRLSVKLELNHQFETAIGLKVSLWFFSIYLSTKNRRIYEWLEPKTRRRGQEFSSGRTIGLSFSEGTLWVELWSDPNEWSSEDPWWWQFNINLKDIIFGKAKHIKRIIKKGGAEIEMPEGIYPANFEISKQTWKRPRWFTKASETIWFDLPVGIPRQGKGENFWDCGMTATTGIGFLWKGSIVTATKEVALTMLKDRQRYGSLSSPEYAKWRRKAIKKQIKSLEQLSNTN